MMWPLATDIEYPALDQLRDGPPPAVLSLKDPRNEQALAAEVEAALREAAKQKVTILVFPELAIPPGIYARVRALLAAQEGDSHPLLTVLGLCHACPPGGSADVNEAVLLGPDGTELHRHRKLTRYGMKTGYPCGEGTETGLEIHILLSPIGNLALLICLDLLHKDVVRVITDSVANVFLVPSLSPSTGAHRDRATTLCADQLASTFVCNRWLQDAGSTATSFYRVPSREWGEVLHLPADTPAGVQPEPYLLFEL
jgi:predicted amidohydrolase